MEKPINVSKYVEASKRIESMRDYLRRYGADDNRYIRSYREDLAGLEEEVKPMAEKLKGVIDTAQGKSRERLICPETIGKVLAEVEKNLGTHKKDMVGIIVDVDIHAQDFPKAYKGTPQSTRFRAEYRKSGWFLTDVCRGVTRRSGHRVEVSLTDEAKAAIIRNYCAW